MRTKLYGFLILLSVMSVSCQKNIFDLSKVKLGDNPKNYDLENKDIFLKDEGEMPNVIVFDADENKNMFFGKIPLDSNLGTQITVYKNKVAGIQTNSNPKNSLEFIQKILKLNGKPTHQVSDKAHVDEKFDKKVFSQFKKIFPQDVFWIKTNQIIFDIHMHFLGYRR